MVFWFNSITKLGEIPVLRGGVIVKTFSIYRAEKMLESFPRPYGNGMNPIDPFLSRVD
jgi:hypothetical protein